MLEPKKLCVLFPVFTSLLLIAFITAMWNNTFEYFPKQDIRSKRLLVIGVLSADHFRFRRDSIRNTWAATLSPNLPLDVIYKFMLDNPTPATEKENKECNDIIYLNVTPTTEYATGLAEKLHAWYIHVSRHFPSADLIAKTDDDTYPCAPNMFEKLLDIYSNTLYFGFEHGDHLEKVTNRHRHDEMFVVIGKTLLDRLVSRTFCKWRNLKFCGSPSDLSDGDYGGTSLGKWISVYNDTSVHTDKGRMAHSGRGMGARIKQQKTSEEFCSQNILFHKATPSLMYRFFNGQQKITPIKNEENIFKYVPNIVKIHETVKLVKKDDLPFCERWIVVSNNFTYTGVNNVLKSLPEWCMVIVILDKNARKKSFSDVEAKKRFVLLTSDMQEQLFPILADFIPWLNGAKRNLGYIFAIHHGAQYILDSADANLLTQKDVQGLINRKYLRWNKGQLQINDICKSNITLLEFYKSGRLASFEDVAVSIKNKAGCTQTNKNVVMDVMPVIASRKNLKSQIVGTNISQEMYLFLPSNKFVIFDGHVTIWGKRSFLYLQLPVSFAGNQKELFRNILAEFYLRKNNSFSFALKTFKQNQKDGTQNNSNWSTRSHSLWNVLNSVRPDIGLEELYLELYRKKFLEYNDLNVIRIWMKTFNAEPSDFKRSPIL